MKIHSSEILTPNKLVFQLVWKYHWNIHNFVYFLLQNYKHCMHDDIVTWKSVLHFWSYLQGMHWSQIDSSWWRHQMETFSALLAICAGNSPVPGEFPHKGQWRGALMFTLICARINGWVNNIEAGDLRRYLPHYDVIVMLVIILDK